MTLIEVLQGIDGAATARRVGTDALSPSFAQLLPMAFPNAELVDGELAMRAARRIKTPTRSPRCAARSRVAEDGLAAAVAELRAGRHRTGADRRAAGGDGRRRCDHAGDAGRRLGDVARNTPGGGPAATAASSAGDLVAFAAGVLADGYVGEVGRTWPVGDVRGRRRSLRSTTAGMPCGTGSLRPVSPGSRPATCSRRTRRPANRCRRCRSPTASGLGFDPPVVSPDLPNHAAAGTPRAGMVLAVTGYVWEEGVGAVFGREAVLITADGPEVLTSSPSWRPRRRRNQLKEYLWPTTQRVRSRRQPEEIILYEKDPTTKIATITLQPARAPQRADDRHAAALRRPAAPGQHRRRRQGLVIRGDGDDLGSGADLPEFMEGNDNTDLRLRRAAARGRRRRRGQLPAEGNVPPRRDDQRSGTPTRRRAAGRCRSSRRSASSRPRATATAGTSTRAADADLVISSDDALFGHPRSATTAGARGCGGGRRRWGCASSRRWSSPAGRSPPRRWTSATSSTASCRATSSRPRSTSTRWPARSNRPDRHVFMQKIFFEIMKQFQGEYMGSLLSGVLRVDGQRRRRTTTPTTST